MIRDDLQAMTEAAARAAMDAGTLPHVALPEILIERPARPEHGDYATNLPMRLARAAKANPQAIAQAIVEHMPTSSAVAAVEVAAPAAFINFRLSEQWLAQQVDAIVAEGPAFGNVPLGNGKRVLFGEIFITVRATLDHFRHETLHIVAVWLNTSAQQFSDVVAPPLSDAGLLIGGDVGHRFAQRTVLLGCSSHV